MSLTLDPIQAERCRISRRHSWIASDFFWEHGYIYPAGPVICGGCGKVLPGLDGPWRPAGTIRYWPLWDGELPGVSLSGEPTEAGGGTVPDRSRPPHLGCSWSANQMVRTLSDAEVDR